MPHICVVADGPLDLIVAERLLGTFGLDAPRELARVTNGKTQLDERLTIVRAQREIERLTLAGTWT